MEKIKNKKWYHYLIIYILGFIIYTTIVITTTYCINNKKAGAYTNYIVNYANVTDLTNTTWVFNDSIELYNQMSGWSFNIIFNSDNEDFDNITFNNWYIYDEVLEGQCEILYGISNESDIRAVTGTLGTNILNQWTNQAYKIITITGGTDVTNSDLINLLNENATIQQNEEFYNISYNLQNVLIIGNKPTQISNLEEIEIEIQNFNNYELPQNIMVENASYNWNYETGILTIYDATGNVNITIRAEYISGNYSFIELIDSVVLIPLNTFFNLFNYELFGVNIYALLTATLTLFVIIKILLKVFK